MLDFIKHASATETKGREDLFAGCASAQEITDAFQQELARAIADSQDVKPVLADNSACQGVFDKIDTSDDGLLSHDEAIAALMPVVEDQDIAERIYGILDPTGSGQVGQDRFNQCLDTVIKVTSFEAHLNIMEMTQTSGTVAEGSDFSDLVAGLRSQDGISGQPVSTGGLSVDAFWMKLMEELDKNRQGGAPEGASSAEAASAPVVGQTSGQSMSFQTATYAEASISVETVSANLGAVFSAMA
ncbi:MAG: hypothetical protein OEL53_13355 [Rhodospirillales bacterium]|nr:hypothetical protein [Rhodospirillales bacterium]